MGKLLSISFLLFWKKPGSLLSLITYITEQNEKDYKIYLKAPLQMGELLSISVSLFWKKPGSLLFLLFREYSKKLGYYFGKLDA